MHALNLDPDLIKLTVFVAVVIGLIFLVRLLISEFSAIFFQPPPPPRTPEQLAQDAAWYRAEQRRLEAQTAYELQKAELEDTRRFLKQRK